MSHACGHCGVEYAVWTGVPLHAQVDRSAPLGHCVADCVGGCGAAEGTALGRTGSGTGEERVRHRGAAELEHGRQGGHHAAEGAARDASSPSADLDAGGR